MTEPSESKPAAQAATTTTDSANTPAAEAQPTPATLPDPPTPAAETQGAQATEGEPSWLPERLERARRQLLRELDPTFTSEGDAKKAVAELKTRREAEQTELERLQTENKTLRTAVADREALHGTVAARAAVEIAALAEPQQAAVRAVAGDDPQAQLTTIEAMRPTWAATAAAPVPAPASTTAAAPAPAEAPAGASTNHLATYEALQTSNPMQAAYYRLQHGEAIAKAQKARA
jgi:hypothetical protein